MENPHSQDGNRLRWTVIDKIVEDTIESHGPTTYTNSAAAYTSYAVPQTTNRIEQHGVLLKRLLKPMYHHASHIIEQSHYSPTRLYVEHLLPEIDNRIYVDMFDKTMWIAIEEPLPLNEFYKMIISNEMAEGKYSGYTIDTIPSTNLVPLVDLKTTFVEWWCN